MSFMTVIASIALALLGLVQAGPAEGVGLREPLRIVSDSHHIDFPNSITLTLEAELETPVTEMRVFYRVGQRNPSVYGYPDFTQGTHVTATFTIRTGGASYVPSGADIEYYYVLVDADGNRYETERRVLEYKDPAYNWQRYEHGDIIVLFHDRPLASVAEAARVVNDKAQEIKALLGLESVRPQKAVIVNGLLEAQRTFPTVSDTATEGHLFGGFAFGQYDLFILNGLGRDGMVHEMTHLLIDEALRSPLANIPTWLNEGLAMYFEWGSHGRQSAVLDAARKGRLLPLAAMRAMPGRPEDVRLYYAQSWSIVDYMMREHGHERMTALFESVKQGRRIEDALVEAYGMTLAELEQGWKMHLTREAPGELPFDPGTLGTSAIIGGAVALTVVIMVLRWIRHLVSPPVEAGEEPEAPGRGDG